MSVFGALLGSLGLAGVAVSLVMLGLLSRRMGRVTRARPFHIGLWASAVLVLGGVVGRLAFAGGTPPTLLTVVLAAGLPAVGLSMGVMFAGRTWSWLLAERNG